MNMLADSVRINTREAASTRLKIYRDRALIVRTVLWILAISILGGASAFLFRQYL